MTQDARNAFRAGRLDDARRSCEADIAQQGPSPGRSILLAEIVAAQGDIDRAREELADVRAAYPGNLRVLVAIATTMRDMGDHPAALACVDAALALRPHDADALARKGTILCAMRRFDEAVAALRASLQRAPDRADVLHAMAILHRERGDLETAIGWADRALAVDDRLAEAWNTRACCLADLAHDQAALRDFDRALGVDPHYAMARAARGLVRLRLGDLQGGFTDYEARTEPPRLRRLASEAGLDRIPRWTGAQSLVGRSLLLHGEQGLGDVVQFVRFVPHLARLGARVRVLVPEAVRLLCGTVEGVERVTSRVDEVRDSDFYCPLMSLPLALGTTLESIPADVPYLGTCPIRGRAWDTLLGPRDGRPRVGLCWRGNPRHLNDHNRSLAIADLAPLLKFDVDWVSLQLAPTTDDLRFLADHRGVRRFEQHFQDYAITAALIARLDLVITVDSSVAHVAGALGKPVWILVPANPDWRWMTGRRDSPWYPTARLFRQPVLGEWGTVVAALERGVGSASGVVLRAPDREVSTGSPADDAATPVALEKALIDRFGEVPAELTARDARALLALDPENYGAHAVLGILASRAGRHDESLTHFEAAARAHPFRHEAHANLARTLASLGRQVEAVAAFDAAIALGGDDPAMGVERARALAGAGRHADALAAYDALLRDAPALAGLAAERASLAEALEQAARRKAG